MFSLPPDRGNERAGCDYLISWGGCADTSGRLGVPDAHQS